ncbi:Translation initiation factor IF-2 [Bienertia sinuspersici]
MGEQKEEELYRNFSRKDLQGLCKKYGLPANKSNSEMATSLILYLEASEDVGILTQLHRESNSGAGIPENTFSSVLSSTAVTPSPTFTFDVCCEDGIQLSVDLDSSPLDWIENLKAGVRICDDMHKPKSQSFHEDIGLLCSKEKSGSIVMDPSNETDKGQLEEGCFPTTSLTGIQAQADEAERYLSSPGLKPLDNVGHSLENSGEVQAILSSRLESGTEGRLPNVRSSRSEGTLVTDLDANAAVQTGMCNLTGNSWPSDLKCSRMPARQGASADGDLDKNPSLPQSYSSLDPVLNCGEMSTIVCMEMQASTCPTISQDIERFPSKVGKCVDLSEQLKDTKMLQCGIVESVQTTPNMNELLTWPAQTVDHKTCMPCYPVLNSLSADLADNRCKVDAGQRKSSFLGKSDRQKREAQTHPAEDAGFPKTHEAARENGEVQRKDAALDPCCNARSQDLVAPTPNGVDHRIRRSLLASNVGNLGKSNTGNEREGSEYLNFDNLVEKPCKEPVDSKSNKELKRKRHMHNFEGQNKFANAEAKNLRSSKQFAGDHSKRRRSSRLYTK